MKGYLIHFQAGRTQFLALPATHYVTKVKMLNCPKSQFPNLYNGDAESIYLVGLLYGFNKMRLINHSAQGWACC